MGMVLLAGPHRFPTGSCKGAATIVYYTARNKRAGWFSARQLRFNTAAGTTGPHLVNFSIFNKIFQWSCNLKN